MLHLYSFIWFCLLVAAFFGALLGYWWWGRSHKPTSKTTLTSELLAEIEGLKAELGAASTAQETLKTERDQAKTEIVSLTSRLAELTQSHEALQKSATNASNGPKTLGDLEAIATERDLLAGERDQLKAALTRAQAQISAHTQALAQANTNIQTANTTIQTAQLQLQTKEVRLREQAAELSRLRADVPLLPTTSPNTATGLVIPAVEPGRTDDLKEIMGVGPFIESKLQALGILTFKQIALLSPEILEQVAENIEHFQGRIGRENWIEQCKALHFDKYGEKL